MRPGALVEDQYAMAIKNNAQTVGHVPKFLSKLVHFFQKHEGELLVEVIGERRFSFDLPQGGMEIPAKFTFKTENIELFQQMQEKTLEQIEKFEERRKIAIEKSLNKKEKRIKNNKKLTVLFFSLLFSADRLKFSSNF